MNKFLPSGGGGGGGGVRGGRGAITPYPPVAKILLTLTMHGLCRRHVATKPLW